MIDRAIRDLDRERMALQQQEGKLVAEIKRFANENQLEAARVTAKSVVRNRNAVTKLYQLKSQLQAVSLRMAELKSTQAMTDAMKGTTKAMAVMNRKLQQPAIAKIMREFERQNHLMNSSAELMDDVGMSSSVLAEDEEMETDQLVSQVLDEIGVDVLRATPSGVGLRATGSMARANNETVSEAVDRGGNGGMMVQGGDGGSEGDGDMDQLLSRLQGLRGGVGHARGDDSS